ncbi:hypothetical protein DFQ14_10911 [Halopolyspora algeriensis]|uniref:DUF1440 domain-containing protein n=2 Tax=Halopolyspora algeriensis TaxID=1500506 RepID=A0A368VKU5_9ACTN|nr:hypothetical protein DFQ14_10911 [Halopolyspora algeriensis]TQM53980.1 hypothetical protein FHU43_2157 [Halopolyspora algeriensis]
MAMTGIRTVTANVGLVGQSPPEAIVDRHAPAGIQRLPQQHRTALTELAHWSYGATGGVVFGMLPPRMRAYPGIGPVYGLAIWASFEAGIAPLLGVQRAKQTRTLSRALIAADHVLYGIVVAGRLAPEPQVIARKHRSRSPSWIAGHCEQ